MKVLSNLLYQCINKHELRYDDACSLKVDCLVASIAQAVNVKHARVHSACELREYPFEPCEEWWVVQCPF